MKTFKFINFGNFPPKQISSAEASPSSVSLPILQSSTATTSLSASAVGWHGCDVLNSADLHAGTGQGAQGRLGTRTGSARADAAGGAETNMKGIDAFEGRNALCS